MNNSFHSGQTRLLPLHPSVHRLAGIVAAIHDVDPAAQGGGAAALAVLSDSKKGVVEAQIGELDRRPLAVGRQSRRGEALHRPGMGSGPRSRTTAHVPQSR